MRHLYSVDDNGATYWVIAESEVLALAFVLLCEDRDDYGDYPYIREICTKESLGKLQFVPDEEEEPCTMWYAYLIARDLGSGILACSEWP